MVVQVTIRPFSRNFVHLFGFLLVVSDGYLDGGNIAGIYMCFLLCT